MFAVIYEGSYTTDGGHGYGVYTSTYDAIEKFDSEAQLLRWVDSHPYTKHQVIKYEVLQVEKTLTLKLKK